MATAKELVRGLLDAQPDDATYDEIVREILFKRMVDRGLEDVREGKVISDAEMERRIQSWST